MTQLELESPDLLLERQQKSFPSWFSQHIKHLRSQRASEASDELYALACGPDTRVNLYPGCIVNGVRFHVKARDDRLRTQNSGVVVPGEHDDDIIDFYGYLSQVVVLDYLLDFRVVLFKCQWYDTDPKRKRVKTDYHFTSVNCTRKWYLEDPFVLAQQAHQVYYIDDPKLGSDWKVVQRVQHRHIWNILEKDEVEEEINSVEPDAYQQNDSSDLILTVDQNLHDEIVEAEDDDDDDDDAERTNGNDDLDDSICDELLDDTIDEYFTDEEDNSQSDDDTDIDM